MTAHLSAPQQSKAEAREDASPFDALLQAAPPRQKAAARADDGKLAGHRTAGHRQHRPANDAAQPTARPARTDKLDKAEEKTVATAVQDKTKSKDKEQAVGEAPAPVIAPLPGAAPVKTEPLDNQAQDTQAKDSGAEMAAKDKEAIVDRAAVAVVCVPAKGHPVVAANTAANPVKADDRTAGDAAPVMTVETPVANTPAAAAPVPPQNETPAMHTGKTEKPEDKKAADAAPVAGDTAQAAAPVQPPANPVLQAAPAPVAGAMQTAADEAAPVLAAIQAKAAQVAALPQKRSPDAPSQTDAPAQPPDDGIADPDAADRAAKTQARDADGKSDKTAKSGKTDAADPAAARSDAPQAVAADIAPQKPQQAAANTNLAVHDIAAPQGPVPARGVAPALPQHVQVTAQPAAPDLPKLAVEIAARTQSGARQFDIRLDPPELGRVDVRLSIDHDGKTSAHLTADQPQTLDMLQKDASSLTRALRDAGLDVSQNGLNFSLRQQTGQSGGNAQGGHRGGRGAAVLTATASVQATATSAPTPVSGNGRVDIRI